MDLEQLAYSLPSAQAFIDSIADGAGNGVSIVVLPDNLSREMASRLIRDRLSARNYSLRELSNPRQEDPVSASSDALDAIWPSDRTPRSLRNLLGCEGLPDLLLLRRIGPSRSLRNSGPSSLRDGHGSGTTRVESGICPPSLCVIAKLRDFAFRLPEADSGLTYYWWWGFSIGVGDEARL